jgi:Na+-driven multidrug efflux pump
VQPVLEYAGPLFVITAARIVGFSAMALTAATLGTVQLAAYQVIISLYVVFVFVSGPISQSAQTLLPALIEAKDSKPLRKTFKNLLVLAGLISAVTTTLYAAALRFGASAFSSDVAVLNLVKTAGTSSLLPMATLLILGTVDGAMTAAKDFRIVVAYQLVAVCVQLIMLAQARAHGWGLPFIFMTFTIRLWICGASASTCIFAGIGRLGGAMGLARKA